MFHRPVESPFLASFFPATVIVTSPLGRGDKHIVRTSPLFETKINYDHHLNLVFT